MNTQLARRRAELVGARRPFVQATVVRAERPTSALAGDQAIVLEDGSIEGFVGGQCTEASVQVAAMDVLHDGTSLLLRVLPDGAPAFPESAGARVVVNPCLSGGAVEIYLEAVLPVPVVYVAGGSPIARAVVELARSVGYEATSSEEGASPAGASAMVIARLGGPEPDDLRAALAADVRYIGLVASRTRGRAVLDETGLDDRQRARVHTPAGLPIGARTPEEIALSILAEIVSVLREPDVAAAAVPSRPEVATDPVCGMRVLVAPDAIRLEVDGTGYYFCGSGCRDAFAAQHQVSAG